MLIKLLEKKLVGKYTGRKKRMKLRQLKNNIGQIIYLYSPGGEAALTFSFVENFSLKKSYS